ncbi:hypothetical protein FSP39_023876 [Pinctada imbricata]|uniref:DDE-1 domain-containing protein n=1 Tax=Pinctada imbricata TaxID=66713 RepID=A0AA88YGA9_PINIB|nr:hypothetical protein FSP39_023876 [Pinctada imbricata]
MHGEKKDADEGAATQWKESTLPTFLPSYHPDDIYNADETGIYFRALPDGTLTFKTDNSGGSKKSKERVTVLVCTNMTGTDKRKLLVIGKSKDPRCFRGVKSLPVTYTNSGNAWMTAEIFQNWLRDFNRDMARQKRKILLFVDNCSAHPKGSADRLANIKMEFLPPNTTSIIQPCDQGIIRNLKFYYRSEVIRRIIGNIDNTEMTANELARKLTLLDAVHLLRRAWRCVKESTVTSSYRTAEFVAPEQQEHCEDEDEDVPPVPSGLDAESFSTFVSHDDDLPCFASRSDEEICAEIRETAADVDSEDEDDFTPLELPVSATEARAAIETLRKFLGQKQSDDFDQLYELEDTCERLIDTSRKQTKITEFINWIP